MFEKLVLFSSARVSVSAVFANTAKRDKNQRGTWRSRCWLVRFLEGMAFAGFEVASYLWLDILEVDINVGYCKHLTVRISIRLQPDAQPLKRVKRVMLRHTSSWHIPREEECIIVDASLRRVRCTRPNKCAQRRRKCTQISMISSQWYLFTYSFYFSVNWPSRNEIHTNKDNLYWKQFLNKIYVMS